MSTFVAVGNATQPFLRLLDAVEAIRTQLPQPVFVQFGAAAAAARYAGRGAAFVDMESFERHVRGSQVLILHAGAGSVIHAIRAGKVPVVVPRRAALGEHVDDHQLEFAAELEKSGKALVAHDAESILAAMPRALQLQADASAQAATAPPLIALVRDALRAGTTTR
ncbi:glycosyltransferase [Ramlibacter sp. PS4R-6]|uniref:glycosyltransferase n=1 Tax=Ramlibacter sp. PS4R-6 TaxID=3133438 RepID=UPI00309D11C2